MQTNDIHIYMREALTEAALARDRGDLAVGAVVVVDGEIVGRGGKKVKSTLAPLGPPRGGGL